jgi:hypothetical protein
MNIRLAPMGPISEELERQPDKTASSNVENTGKVYQSQAIALIKLCWFLSRLSQQRRLQQHLALRT